MSWSVQAVGKPKAVAAYLAEQFAKNPCIEPEETIRQGIATILATSLEVMPEASAVKVDACGSQSNNPDGKTNSLTVKIEPIYGFVE